MTIIRHSDQPEISGYRQIIGKHMGAHASTLWDQLLPPDACIVPHYHECEETLTFLTGQAEVTINRETHVVEASSSILIPAHTVHQVRNSSTGEVRLLAFFPTNEPKVVPLTSEFSS